MPRLNNFLVLFFFCLFALINAQEADWKKTLQAYDSLYEKSRFAEAGILAQKAYDDALNAQNDTLTARFGTLLAGAYLALNYTDGVLNMLEDSKRIQDQYNDACIVETYYTLGLYYLANKEPEKARVNLLTSINLLNNTQPNYQFQGRTHVYMGLVSEKLSNLEEALKYYQLALSNFEHTPSVYYQNYALAKIAGIEIKQGQVAEAYEKSNRVLEVSIREKFPMLESMAYKRLADIFIQKKQWDEAFKYLQKYQEVNEQILLANQHQLFPLKKSGELTVSESIIQNFKATEQKNAKTIRNLYLTLFMGISLIILLSLLFITMYRNNNVRTRNNEILRVKNQQLEIAKNKAEEAADIRERFISTISHELRTPLYAVTGITHLLMKEDPKPEQMENLNSLRYSGDYLLALVNDILEINRLDSDKATVDFDKFNLKELVKQVVQSMQETSKANKNQIHTEIDPRMPDQIMTDEVKVSQVLHNLIGNAVKFTSQGDIWVRIKINWIKETSMNFTFEVEDSGIGIDEDYLENIFDNFSQGNTEINKKFGGTGLGLAIVKRILALLDAEIKVKSKLGEGSTFYFDLTVKLSNGEESEEITHFDLSMLKGKKVLIVEDNRINQMITRKIVESVGMTCDVVDNGTKAVEMVKSRKYDGVLMDIHMPGISGIEATRYIRIFNTHIPIIALTALSLSEKRQELLACGIDDLLNKPFKPDEFYRKLFKLLV